MPEHILCHHCYQNLWKAPHSCFCIYSSAFSVSSPGLTAFQILIFHWTVLLPHRGLSSGGQLCVHSAHTSLIDCIGNSGYRELVQFGPWHAFQSSNLFHVLPILLICLGPSKFLTGTHCSKYFTMLPGEYQNLFFGKQVFSKNTTSKQLLPFCQSILGWNWIIPNPTTLFFFYKSSINLLGQWIYLSCKRCNLCSVTVSTFFS